LEKGFELLHVIDLSLGIDFHIAIVKILDCAEDMVVTGRVTSVVSESDTLDSAFDNIMIGLHCAIILYPDIEVTFVKSCLLWKPTKDAIHESWLRAVIPSSTYLSFLCALLICDLSMVLDYTRILDVFRP
jgi:hypothetical protein